jgi:hypothetical protein
VELPWAQHGSLADPAIAAVMLLDWDCSKAHEKFMHLALNLLLLLLLVLPISTESGC